MLSMRSITTVLLAVLLACGQAAAAGDLALEEVGSLGAVGIAQLKPGTIAFTDHRKDDLADPATGLIKFEDWARVPPVQKQFLSLYPGYVEPIVDVTRDGVTKPTIEKLQMYVAEARFLVNRAPAAVDLSRYATLPFLERIDPAITHKLITAARSAAMSAIHRSIGPSFLFRFGFCCFCGCGLTVIFAPYAIPSSGDFLPSSPLELNSIRQRPWLPNRGQELLGKIRRRILP